MVEPHQRAVELGRALLGHELQTFLLLLLLQPVLSLSLCTVHAKIKELISPVICGGKLHQRRVILMVAH